MPILSVIIPAFNAAEFLESAIASVAGQTFQDLEVIVVDDRSSDGTATVAKNLLEKYRLPGIVFVKPQGFRKGAGGARNAGAQKAKGEILAFLDSDDNWTPEHLARAVSKLGVSDQKVVAYCAKGLGINLRTGATHPIPRDGFSQHGFCDMRPVLLGGMVIPNQTLCVNAKAFQQVGGYSEKLSCYEDWWLVLNLSRLGTFFVDERIGCNVAIRDSSLSNQTTASGRPYMSPAMFRDALRFVRFARQGMRLSDCEVSQLTETVTGFVGGQLFASLRARLRAETQMILAAIFREFFCNPLLGCRILARTIKLSANLARTKLK